MNFNKDYAKSVSEKEFVSHFESMGAPFNTVDLRAKYYELRDEKRPDAKKDLKEVQEKEK